MTHKPVQSNEKWPAPNRIFYLVVFLGVTIKIYTDSNRICVSFDDLFSRVTQEMPIFMSQNLIFQLSAYTQHNEITIVIIEICITDSLTTECFSPHIFHTIIFYGKIRRNGHLATTTEKEIIKMEKANKS